MSDAIQAITMPKWGLAMDEGMVTIWLVEEGAPVAAGDELLEIETTKITNVFESPAAGVLRRRLVGEGETVPVGALLAVVAGDGAAEAEIEAFVERFRAEFAVAAEASAESAAVEPESVEAGGRPINYLRAGTGEGLPIVLVHGFGGDLNNWLFNQPVLAERHTVYALDLPGHGRSAKDVGAGDLAFLSGTLAEFLGALRVERAHLVGHSLGGAVVLALALDHPRRAASLTLISPAGLGPEINRSYVAGFVRAARRKEMKAVLQMLFADPGLVSRDLVEDVLKYKRLDGVAAALESIARAAFPNGRQAVVMADHLGELAVPTQVIWGRRDQIVPPAHAEALPAKVALHMIESAGHMAHMEAAGEVNRLIAAIAVR
jgi:pyruvate dehydrogenase E2 component (dihydrolipoamide acetyltransferase)